VFAPFENIGAIIVDEEHETSYKSDMAPKYDTVEVAIRRARASGAVTLLGSATPSIVSMYRAETGVYRLITMTKRYNENPLPSIVLADMREELSRGNRSIFSTALHERMKTSLTRGRQIILFLNRRGYSPFVECLGCGYALSCSNCGLSMTYHKHEGTMVCHFCGMTLALPTACPQCGSPRLRQLGIGTEKVEELTAEAFAGANISRLDLDTASRKGSAAKILDDFAKKKADILIGTQMVAKGLDFANVDLVGVIAADISLNIPDFRSAERTFQLITQAAGRSGRGTEPGEVVVQTYLPDNYAIKSAASNDYKGFYRAELNFRRLMCYPPFSDIVQLTISAASEDDAKYGAEAVCRQIKEQAGKSIQESELLGPQRAAIYYFGELYRYRLYIKMRPEYRRAWEELLAGIKQKANTGKDVRWRLALDVNPYSLL
jgi:primosomal protein N' (replication factor Y)